MANPAIMHLGQQFAGDGDLGTCALGTGPLGGTSWPPFEVPVAQPGSDRLDASEHRQYAELVQERDGLIVGYQLRGSRRKWRQLWRALDAADAQELLEYANAKRFYLLPQGDPEGSKIVVLWLGAEIAAESLRAGYRSLEATWVELTGPAAAES